MTKQVRRETQKKVDRENVGAYTLLVALFLFVIWTVLHSGQMA